MEDGLWLEDGAACFRAIRKRIMERTVGWRVLCRPSAAHDVFLSNCSGRDTLVVTVHHNTTLPYRAYFKDLEPIFREHSGRPNWGKRHSVGHTPEQLRSLYCGWD